MLDQILDRDVATVMLDAIGTMCGGMRIQHTGRIKGLLMQFYRPTLFLVTVQNQCDNLSN